jgi:hypothetical protein
MKPLAAMRTDRRIEQATLGANHGRAHFPGSDGPQTNAVLLPKRSRKMTQKTEGATRTPSRRGFLNRIFTIRPTTSPWGLFALGCRGRNRADFYPQDGGR